MSEEKPLVYQLAATGTGSNQIYPKVPCICQRIYLFVYQLAATEPVLIRLYPIVPSICQMIYLLVYQLAGTLSGSNQIDFQGAWYLSKDILCLAVSWDWIQI